MIYRQNSVRCLETRNTHSNNLPVKGKSNTNQSSFRSALINNAGNVNISAGPYLDPIFKQAADKYGIPENLLKAIGYEESRFQSNAVSSAGAVGIMQLMPQTAKGLGVKDRYDPVQNINGGAKLLFSCLSKYNGNLDLALAAYGAGSGAVDKYGGVPPYTETRNFIKKIRNILKLGASEKTVSLAGNVEDSKAYTDNKLKKSSEETVNTNIYKDSSEIYRLFAEMLRMKMSSQAFAITNDIFDGSSDF